MKVIESRAETLGDLQHIWADAVEYCGPIMLGHVAALIAALQDAYDLREDGEFR